MQKLEASLWSRWVFTRSRTVGFLRGWLKEGSAFREPWIASGLLWLSTLSVVPINPPLLQPHPVSSLMNQPRKRKSLSHPRIAYDQMSRASPFDGRGRALADRRRAYGAVGALDKDDFRRRWSLLMIASFSSRELCAVHFAKTFQTACNWFEGTATPTGEIVHHAMQTLPRYLEIMEGP